jgi:hypothetical protein
MGLKICSAQQGLSLSLGSLPHDVSRSLPGLKMDLFPAAAAAVALS